MHQSSAKGLRTVSLHAFSTRQGRLVQRHDRLIWLIIERHFPRLPDELDLHQEGALALGEAIRSHDPNGHGAFAVFAMARIRCAINRCIHEDRTIRVPYISQRRHRRPPHSDHFRVHGSLPKIFLMTDHRLEYFAAKDTPAGRLNSDKNRADKSLGDVVRDCCDEALQGSIDEISSTHPGSRDAMLLSACATDRWSVPEPECQRSIRELAGDLKCSASHVARWQRKVMARVASRVKNDPRYAKATRMARRKHAGLAYIPSADELRCIESMNHLE